MKKYTVVAAISFFALLIVLPVTCSVNHSAYNPAVGQRIQQADGSPMPAPIPHTAVLSQSLVADGSPMPAPIPHTAVSSQSLVADGSPMPAPIPHATGNGTESGSALIADGSPMPAPIPHALAV